MNLCHERNATAAKRLSDPWPGVKWKSVFRRRLLAWFRKHARALPWRATRDPYAIWISEIMLQQTQVATVIPYYVRFLDRFPSLIDLAAADEQEVLRLWEGLGYYRRARQLHAAAKRIVAEHGGVFPRDVEMVRGLPGIGRYTAGAILSFAFDARLPILEANTRRSFARLLAYQGNPLGSEGQKLLWQAAQAMLPRRGSGAVNQALMELGSQICKPRLPLCNRCPVAAMCKTRGKGLHAVIPPPKAKPRIQHVREAAVVVRKDQRVLLVRRAAAERWGGLWDFPRFSLDGGEAADITADLSEKVAATCSTQITLGPLLTRMRHGVTRFQITLDVYLASPAKHIQKLVGPRNRGCAKQIKNAAEQNASSSSEKTVIHPAPFSDQRWVPLDELANYPLSATGRKIAVLIAARKQSREPQILNPEP